MTNQAKLDAIFNTVIDGPPPGDGPDLSWLLVVALAGGLIVAATAGLRWWLRARQTPAWQRRQLTRRAVRELGLPRDAARTLARAARGRGVASPVTLLLCPSLLQTALRGETGPGAAALRALAGD